MVQEMVTPGNSGTESEGGRSVLKEDWVKAESPLISFPAPFHRETASPHFRISLWFYFGLKETRHS